MLLTVAGAMMTPGLVTAQAPSGTMAQVHARLEQRAASGQTSLLIAGNRAQTTATLKELLAPFKEIEVVNDSLLRVTGREVALAFAVEGGSTRVTFLGHAPTNAEVLKRLRVELLRRKRG
jgi:hypothetical protein